MATYLNPATLSGLSGIARRLVVEGTVSEEEARRAGDASSRQKIPLVSFLVQNGIAAAQQQIRDQEAKMVHAALHQGADPSRGCVLVAHLV